MGVWVDLWNERRAACPASGDSERSVRRRQKARRGETVTEEEGGLFFPAAWSVVLTSLSRVVQQAYRGLGARIAADG